MKINISDLEFIQNPELKKYLSTKIEQHWNGHGLESEISYADSILNEMEVRTEISFKRNGQRMKNIQEKIINDFYNKNKIQIQPFRNQTSQPKDFVSGFENVVNITSEFMNIIRRMFRFNPYQRISMAELANGKSHRISTSQTERYYLK